ncbi:MAG TPA: hypothetical protein VF824_03190 [Thermoanaerobaculia bacterium]|jgi:hypothetical protein
MRRLLLLLLFLPTTLRADVLADVRAALTRLGARDPIHATYELQRAVNNEGRFNDDKFSGKASVEIEGDASGVRFIAARPLLEQVEREELAHTRNPKQPTPTTNALRDITAVSASDAIDCAPSILRLLDGAAVTSDAAAAFQGKPARMVVLKVADRPSNDGSRVTPLENRLTLWLGADLVPLAAEHVQAAKFSFLIFKGEARTKRNWLFARVGDRLVRTRLDSVQSGSGMGQKGLETTVAIVRVH